MDREPELSPLTHIRKGNSLWCNLVRTYGTSVSSVNLSQLSIFMRSSQLLLLLHTETWVCVYTYTYTYIDTHVYTYIVNTYIISSGPIKACAKGGAQECRAARWGRIRRRKHPYPWAFLWVSLLWAVLHQIGQTFRAQWWWFCYTSKTSKQPAEQTQALCWPTESSKS